MVLWIYETTNLSHCQMEHPAKPALRASCMVHAVYIKRDWLSYVCWYSSSLAHQEILERISWDTKNCLFPSHPKVPRAAEAGVAYLSHLQAGSETSPGSWFSEVGADSFRRNKNQGQCFKA